MRLSFRFKFCVPSSLKIRNLNTSSFQVFFQGHYSTFQCASQTLGFLFSILYLSSYAKKLVFLYFKSVCILKLALFKKIYFALLTNKYITIFSLVSIFILKLFSSTNSNFFFAKSWFMCFWLLARTTIYQLNRRGSCIRR